MIDVGNYEKKRVSNLNNELFKAAKELMEANIHTDHGVWHIGWRGVGELIDWLEENYEIKKLRS